MVKGASPGAVKKRIFNQLGEYYARSLYFTAKRALPGEKLCRVCRWSFPGTKARYCDGCRKQLGFKSRQRRNYEDRINTIMRVGNANDIELSTELPRLQAKSDSERLHVY